MVSAFVNPPAIRGDVHEKKSGTLCRVAATLGTATVKINSYGDRFPLGGPVFSFKDWLRFDHLQLQLRFFLITFIIVKTLAIFQ